MVARNQDQRRYKNESTLQDLHRNSLLEVLLDYMFACDSVFSLQTCAASRVYVDELTPVDVDDEVFDTDARVSLGPTNGLQYAYLSVFS